MSKLIPEVMAQSEPTFPYDGPFEEPDDTPVTTDSASIKLTSDSSTLEVGSTITSDITLESSEEEVENYTIIITFDADVLEVVDTNLTQTGVQIEFIDSYSTATTNTANNTSGTITLAATVSGSSTSINRKIAEITFRAKQTGASIISVDKSQSSIENYIGQDVLGSTTSLNLTVTGQTSTTTTTITSNQQLPESGIGDTFAAMGSIFSGILMLYIGLNSIIKRNNKKSHKGRNE